MKVISLFIPILICFNFVVDGRQQFLYASVQDLKAFRKSFEAEMGVRTDPSLDLGIAFEAYKWIKQYFGEDLKEARKGHAKIHGVSLTTVDLLGAAVGVKDILTVYPEEKSLGKLLSRRDDLT
jgi:hypothetical protein